MTPTEFAVALERAGITPDKPLHAVLTLTHDAAVAAGTGARGLTPEGERALVGRVAGMVAQGAERAGARAAQLAQVRTWALIGAAGLGLLVAGFAAGRWDGGASRAEAMAGASFVAQIASLNDAPAMRAYCMAHSYEQPGGLACSLPPVWVRR